MNIIRRLTPALLTGTLLLSSCASEEALENRLEQQNTRYENRQDRRSMRQQAREERSDAWYDRHMY